MAEDVKVLEISTGKSVSNVRELRDYILALKEALNDENATLRQNKETAEELRTAKGLLRDAMYATTKTAQELKETTDAMIDADGRLVVSADGLTTSYNDLVHQLDELKRAWRATTSESERAALTDQIDKVNSKLKEMDASVGTFSRNVGNYTNQVSAWTKKMTAGFTATAGGAASVIRPLNNVTAGLKAMSATPAVAVLGLLANALSIVIRNLKSSEDNVNATNRSFAAFVPIGDAMKRTVQAIGAVVADLSSKIVDLLDKWGLLSDAARNRMALAEQAAGIAEAERRLLVDNAKLEKDAASNRAAAAEKDKYTAEQRIDFLEKSLFDEQTILKNELNVAKARYDYALEESKLTQNSAETKRRLAELEAEMYRAETAYLEKRRGIARQIAAARRQEAQEAASAAREAAQAARERAQASIAELNAERDLIRQEAELMTAGSTERLEKEKDARRLEYEAAVASAKEKVKNAAALQRTLTALESGYLRDIERMDRDHERAVVAEEIRTYRNRMDAAEQGSREYLVLAVELRQRELDTLARLDGETAATFESRMITARRALEEAQHALRADIIEAGRQALENIATAAEDGSLQQLVAQAEVARYQLDNLVREIGESAEAFEGRRLQAAKDYRQAVQAVDAARIEDRRTAIANETAALYDGMTGQLRAIVALRRAELDTLQRIEGESTEAFYKRQLAARREYETALAELTAARETGTDRDYASEAEARLDMEVRLKRHELDTLQRIEGESTEAFRSRQLEAQRAYNDAVAALAEERIEQGRLDLENEMNAQREGSIAQLSAAVELKRYELDTLHQLEGESNAEFRARELDAEKAYHDSVTALWQGRVAMMGNYASAISSLLGGLADIYEQDTANSERAAQQAKNLRIAETTIQTISGAVAAYMAAQTLPPPSNFIVGGLNAAAVTAAGIAQITKIRNTQVNASGTTATPEAPAATAPAPPQSIQQTALVETARNTAQINQDQQDMRVYVVESDIGQAGLRVQVREAEATF